MVQRHRARAQFGGDAAHRDGVETFGVGDVDGRGGDVVSCEARLATALIGSGPDVERVEVGGQAIERLEVMMCLGRDLRGLLGGLAVDLLVVVFPITFLSTAFVPLESLPSALQWVASYNPVSALLAAARELFGNPVTPVVKQVWPMDNPVLASFIYCAIILSFSVPASLHRYRKRTAA